MSLSLSFPLLLASILAGYLLGIFSGLVPGIHTNNFALMLVALSPSLTGQGIPPFYIALAILSNAVAHTFHDIIPSVFLGAPDGDTALAVLPGHRLLLEGFGAEAVRLSALGSAASVVASLIFVLPLSLFFGAAYPYLEEYMAWILLSIVGLMLMSEQGEKLPGQGSLAVYRYRAFALFLFLLTGVLGFFAFRMEGMMTPILSFGAASILLPLLSGLFGASQLVISLLTGSSMPTDSVSRMELSRKRIVRGVLTGSAAGSLVAWLPGVSSAIAALLARLFISEDFDTEKASRNAGIKKGEEKGEEKGGNKEESDSGNSLAPLQKDSLEAEPQEMPPLSVSWDAEESSTDFESAKEFIVSVSGVNTSNAIFGLVALMVIGKTRSGAMAAVNEILGPEVFGKASVLLFFAAILLSSLLSYFSTVFIGNNIHRILLKIDYHKLCFSVLLGLSGMVLLFTGLFGLFIFIISTPIGMLAAFMKVRKSHAMGVILLPVILYFL